MIYYILLSLIIAFVQLFMTKHYGIAKNYSKKDYQMGFVMDFFLWPIYLIMMVISYIRKKL